MNVLVIENEEFLAENLCQYLRQKINIRIQFTTSVKKALTILSQEQFDLIVSDLILPDSQQDEWLLNLGKLNPGQRLIIISSFQIPERVKSSDKLKIVGYFEKPFNINELIKLIKQIKT
ncbi:MAG: response regulator [Calditrichaeota bacterium]|nr:response regulator [Calditrichota bacterium]